MTSRRTKTKPAPETRTNDAQLVVRLPAELIERIDAYAEAMRASMPGARFARAEAVRVLLSRALDVADGRKGRKR